MKGQTPQGGLARRSLVIGAAGLGAAALASLYRFTDIIVKHYPPTPYDDLLNRLTDREQAILLGAGMEGGFDVMHQAARLRSRFANQDLGAAVNADIGAGRMGEIAGWVLPESLALLAVLASKV